MWQVTDGLVELLSVTRGDLKLDRVDLGELARGTLRDLQSAQPERQVEFVCGEGLNVKADAGMMRVLLGSLLGNAWKFSRERQPARIELGSLVEQGKTVYFVRDNGAGFDMAYIQKLFGVFQRLHAADQFEGNGVGLAMAQRIIRRHGGRIWAAAAVNQGATFYFTLQ